VGKLVRGRYVLSGSCGHRTVIRDGAVYIEGDTIRDVGKYRELSREYQPELELGSEDHLVMPGLVNAHHHRGGWGFWFQRGLLDAPLEKWLGLLPVYESQISALSYDVTLFACIKLIESGVTCVLDHRCASVDPVDFGGYKKDLEDSIKAYADSGMKVALAPAIQNRGDWVYDDEERFISELPTEIREFFKPYHTNCQYDTERRKNYFRAFSDLFEKYDGRNGRIRLVFGPTGVQWCTDDLLEEVKTNAKRFETGIHLHLLETKYQMKYGIRKFGRTLVQHLVDLEFLGPDVSCAHSIWLTKEDIDLLAETGATVVHNPTSNCRIFSGIAPVLFMKEKGINVALGMDGYWGLSDDDGMFETMRLAFVLHRVPGISSIGLTSNQILDMSTIGGAKAAGFENEIGAIIPGFKADIILVNLKRAFSPPISSTIPITDVIIHRFKTIDVDTVLVNGEVMMKDKKHTRVDKTEVLRRVEVAVKDINEETRRKLDIYIEYLTDFYRKWDENPIGYTYNACMRPELYGPIGQS